MGSTPPQRTVEVVNPRAGVRGSGCLIAPGLVLAAAHVACPNRDAGPVVIRALEGGAEHEAAVLWTDPSVDVALLQGDPVVLGAGLGIARWAALTCDHAGERPVCTTIGFPQALHLKVPGGPRSAAQAKSLDGRIAPRGRARSGMYVFELDEPDEVSFDLWQGMSGAVVYCDDAIVGVATNAADYWRGETLLVLPAFRLLGAPGFADAVADASGMRPRLRSADLGPLLADQPDPHLSASYFLNPAAAVVPMSGDAATMQALRAWCFNGRRTDVAALTGGDGSGKTRMAYELLGHLSREVRGRAAWTGGFLADTPRQEEPGYALFSTVRQPLLLVVDEAEARVDQLHALFDVLGTRRSGQPVRVLLVVRGREDWWPRLREAWSGSTVMGRGESFHLETADAYADVGAEGFYTRAAKAFADRIRRLRDAGIDDDSPGRAIPEPARNRRYLVPSDDGAGLPVASLHMAALADVLSQYDPALAVHERPLDVLLAREEDHVRRIAAERMPSGLVDSGLLRTLLAVQQLVGARSSDDAIGAVRAGFEVHHRGRWDIAEPQAPVLAAYEEILAAAYPSGDGARWGAIGPEALGAALVAEVEASGDGTFLAALLPKPYLSAAQRYRALSVLVRTAATQPELISAAARAVASAPELLLPIAEWVPEECSTERAATWLHLCRDAVVERASYGAIGADTAAWATNAVDAALLRLAAARGGVAGGYGTGYGTGYEGGYQGDHEAGAAPDAAESRPSAPDGGFVPRPRGSVRVAAPMRPGEGIPRPVPEPESRDPRSPDPRHDTTRTADLRRPDALSALSRTADLRSPDLAAAQGAARRSEPAARAGAGPGAGSGTGSGSSTRSGSDSSTRAGRGSGQRPSARAGQGTLSSGSSGTGSGARTDTATRAPSGTRTTGNEARGAASSRPSTAARGSAGSRTSAASAGSAARASGRSSARDRSSATSDPGRGGPRHGGAPHRHRAPRAAPAHGYRPVSRTSPRPGPARALLTLLALGYLALVAYAACDTFYFTGPYSDSKPAWVFPPMVMLVTIEAALQARHWPGRPEFSDLPAQFLATAVTTTSLAMYGVEHNPDTPRLLLVVAAAVVAGLGMWILTDTVRRWFGQVSYVRDPVNP
ncbi:S1 family peptidase [Yinghuangia soli]|uniref:Trypsin-like peptidase domain-containing protein n=1 Tax=Yinghuangia soli TaxID=2908204 RepID=A0AA41Q327_9ACTN|nr:serine protease [Yinghuangia soli]MCF2530317.1 hypothetical protein [Yinghuangia soli]